MPCAVGWAVSDARSRRPALTRWGLPGDIGSKVGAVLDCVPVGRGLFAGFRRVGGCGCVVVRGGGSCTRVGTRVGALEKRRVGVRMVASRKRSDQLRSRKGVDVVGVSRVRTWINAAVVGACRRVSSSAIAHRSASPSVTSRKYHCLLRSIQASNATESWPELRSPSCGPLNSKPIYASTSATCRRASIIALSACASASNARAMRME